MNKKVLSLIASLVSLGGMGLNSIGVHASDVVKNVNDFSEAQVNYTEDAFAGYVRLALADMTMRIEYPGWDSSSNLTTMARYVVKLDNGESVNIDVPVRRSQKYDPLMHGLTPLYRDLLAQLIPILEKNNIFLPTSSIMLSMNNEFKDLVKTWKDNGIYDSKINEIIKSFMNSSAVDGSETRNIVNFKVPSILNYDENVFATNMRLALCDLAVRMEIPYNRMGGSYPRYILELANGENIDLVSPKKMDDTDMFRVYRYMIDQGISILDKNNIILPTLNVGLYMPDEARELMKKWKDQGIYDEKINSIIMSFMDSYHTWGWTEDDKKYSPDKPDPKDDKEKDANKNDFKEETFVRSMNLAMDDIMTRVSLESFTNGKLDYRYDANLANGENVALKYRRTADSLKEMLRSIIDQGISLLDKSPLFLPSSNNFVYMPHGARDLLNQWKNDGIYDLKIDDMIKSYIDQFFSIAVNASKMQDQQFGTEK